MDKGDVSFNLDSLENFDQEIDVFIYDALLNTYSQFNDNDFSITLEAGNYLNRFYLTFTEESTLDVEDLELFNNQIFVSYLNSTDEIYIKMPLITELKEVSIFNLLGQEIMYWDEFEFISNSEVKLKTSYKFPIASYIIKVNTYRGIVNKKVIIEQE